ncbi:MAG: proton-conducting transporter transmembrane domain-containing protein [Minisyncoccota bacterium]
MVTSLIVVSFAFLTAGALLAFVPSRADTTTSVTYGAFAFGGVAALAASVWSLFLPGAAGAVAMMPAFFLGIIGAGTFLASIYAAGYLPLYQDTYVLPWLAAAFAAFVIGMEAVVLAPSVLLFLLAWEVMSVAAYFLVIADRSDDSLHAGLVYLVMTQFGFAAIASGLLLLSGGAPLLTWHEVQTTAAQLSPRTLGVAFILLLVGFGSKAGLVPFHQWLPQAHPQAPSHASAMLSGVMLKIALFGFLMSLGLFPGIPLALAVAVIVLGLLSAFFGALHAAVEDDLKRLLAWSSIENMGLIFSAIGVVLALAAMPATPLSSAIAAGATIFVVLHTLNHFLFKSSLFFAAGTIVAKTHTRDLDALGGLAARWPFFSGVVLALALAAAALPPLGTFFGEWVYLQSLALGFAAPLPLAIVAVIMLGVIGLVGGLSLFAFVKLFSTAFLGRARSEHAANAGKSLSPLLVIPPFLGALALVFSSLFAFPLLSAAGVGGTHSFLANTTIVPSASMNAWLVTGLLLMAVGIVLLGKRMLVPAGRVRVTGTWDCGTPLTPRMEQTATGFAAPIRFFFRSIVLARKEFIAESVVASNPWIADRRILWSVASFWERFLYQPIVTFVLRTARAMRPLQSGAVQRYLLFMLIALIIVLSTAL